MSDGWEQVSRDLAASFPEVDPVETLLDAIESDIRGAHGMAAGFRATGELMRELRESPDQGADPAALE